jgi:hypothetical protein
MPPIPFATSSYRHESLPISAQRVLNCYAERQPQGAKSQVTVHGSPGIITFATCGTGPIRGRCMLGGVLYVVSGGSLYSVSNDPTPVVTELGGVISGSGVVSMADNGNEIMIVNGSLGYLYDTTSGFRLVTDTDFVAGNTVTYSDGFFLVPRANTNEWARSDSLDGSSWNALAFATKEAKSDNLRAVLNVNEVIHLLGEKSSELDGNNGAANFPYQRIPGGTLDRGIIAPYATAQEDQGLFVLGDDRIAYRMSGTQLSRISNHAIEQTWQGYTATSDCFGLAYTWKGHKFAAWTFPTQQAALGDTTSWVFDISSGLWHERLSYDLNGVPLGRWRGNMAIDAYGKTLIGDAFSGRIGYLSNDVTTEFDCPVRFSATSQPYSAGDKALFHSQLTLDMEAGVGLSTGQGSDPQVMLDVSDDGGRTWASVQYWSALGRQGAYTTWVRYDQLGSTERGGTRVYRATISDPVRRTLIGAHSDMYPGI